jgi:predicted metal-dependent HD superfamily phosphohydrolase
MFQRPSSKSGGSAATGGSTARSNGRGSERGRFMALWGRCLVGEPSVADEAFARLAELYGEPHRHYHTLDHIWRCLAEFDRAAELMDEPDAVEMALWFHDAIYVSGAKDNESRSAELFQQWSDEHAEWTFRRRVHDLIMVTTHREWPRWEDERFIVDIDLSGFGLPWDEFERDGHLIRAECVAMTDEEYYPGQLRFLLSLQNRPTFFFTDYFQQRYELAARANTRRVVESLRARGYGDA